MLPGLFSFYSWHNGVVDFLDLALETSRPLDLVTSTVFFLSRALGVYPKTLGWLITLCAGYCDYMLSLWSRIHLYMDVTLSNFCEDLMYLKLGILKRFIIFACLVSIQRMRILHWLIMSSLSLVLVRRFFSLAFTLCFRIVPSSPPIFFNFKNLLPPFEKSSCFLTWTAFIINLDLCLCILKNIFLSKL